MISSSRRAADRFVTADPSPIDPILEMPHPVTRHDDAITRSDGVPPAGRHQIERISLRAVTRQRLAREQAPYVPGDDRSLANRAAPDLAKGRGVNEATSPAAKTFSCPSTRRSASTEMKPADPEADRSRRSHGGADAPIAHRISSAATGGPPSIINRSGSTALTLAPVITSIPVAFRTARNFSRKDGEKSGKRTGAPHTSTNCSRSTGAPAFVASARQPIRDGESQFDPRRAAADNRDPGHP